MKKIAFFVCTALILTLCTASCTSQAKLSSESEESYRSSILSLESQLERLKEEQYISESEKQQKISELQDKLNALRSESADTTGSQASIEITQVQVGYLYTVENGEATVTGYRGDDRQLVIPASIDGYKVTAIGANAFEDSALTSVIISDGIVSVGWFAFNGCNRLTSVTVPNSVTEIGYYAFGHTGSSVTVYCHSGSFAQSYAQSFGLSYTVI